MSKSVFVGGSISIYEKFPIEVRTRLNNIIKKGYDIIVGDAPGVDKLLQRYFTEHSVMNMTVYGIGLSPRNNIGNNPYKRIPLNKGCRNPYESKDIEMCKDCDYAFFIWDGKSKGTEANIIRCVSSKTLRGKYIYVLVYCKGKMYELKRPEHYSEMEREIKNG